LTAVVADPKRTVFGIKLGLAGLFGGLPLTIDPARSCELGDLYGAGPGAGPVRRGDRNPGRRPSGGHHDWRIRPGVWARRKISNKIVLIFLSCSPSFTFFFCMYMFGGSIFPYGLFLCVPTRLVTVSSSGIFDPTNAWHVGLARTLGDSDRGGFHDHRGPTCSGRGFARQDFLHLARAALGNVGETC